MAEALATKALEKPRPLRWHHHVLASLIRLLISGMMLTARMRVKVAPGFQSLPPDLPIIYYTWHNRLALAIRMYRIVNRIRKRHRRMATLVSASKDGGVLAEVLEKFDAQPVRGSTSRRGPQALKEMTTWLRRGLDLAVTPDGPRGPRYALQDGVISLAQVSGKPLVAVGCKIHWKIQLKSWDRFQIPLPFSRCECGISEPFYVPRRISEEEKQSLRRQLEKALNDICQD